MAKSVNTKINSDTQRHGIIETLVVNFAEWAYLAYLVFFIYMIWSRQEAYFIGDGDWFMYAIIGLLLFWTLPIGATFLSKFVLGKRQEYNLFSGGALKRFGIMMALLGVALFGLPMPTISMEFKLLLMLFFLLRIGTDFSNRFQIFENGLIWGGVCYRRGEIESYKDTGTMIEVYWKDNKKKKGFIARATSDETKKIKKILKEL